MREHRVTVPQLAALAVTRGMIGFGAGLLASERLRSKRRHQVGLALFGVGLLSTIPIALRLFRRRAEPIAGSS